MRLNSWYNQGSNHGILGSDFWKIRPKQLTDILYEFMFQFATNIPEFRRSDITLGYILQRLYYMGDLNQDDASSEILFELFDTTLLQLFWLCSLVIYLASLEAA
jgi:hypothetical protein